MKMEFYRYKMVQYATMDRDGEYYNSTIPNPKLVLETYNLFKETSKGYWIGFGYEDFSFKHSFKKWVSKSARKRFAYPSKKEALINFIKRTEMRSKILKYQSWSCNISLSVANDQLRELNKIY